MYSAMLPRLEAEQELREYQVACAAGGLQMEDHARTRYVNRLERQAEGRNRPKRIAEGDMAGIGIRVEREGE